MNKTQLLLKGLPKNFKEEERILFLKGITTWSKLNEITNEEIYELIRASKCTYRNINKLKSIAILICEINLSQSQASLLIHSGIASVKALANSTPDEIVKKTEKLKRLLKAESISIINISMAKEWIRKAKERQIMN